MKCRELEDKVGVRGFSTFQLKASEDDVEKMSDDLERLHEDNSALRHDWEQANQAMLEERDRRRTVQRDLERCKSAYERLSADYRQAKHVIQHYIVSPVSLHHTLTAAIEKVGQECKARRASRARGRRSRACAIDLQRCRGRA